IKTALFIILLAAVTAFLCLGVNMWLSVNQSIDAANKAFKTIGVVEYRSPRDSSIDDAMGYDYSPILESDYVEFFDHRGLLAGFSEKLDTELVGKHRRGGTSIIEFTPVNTVSEENTLQVKVNKVHCSDDFSIQEGTVLSVVVSSEIESVEIGKKYLTGIMETDYKEYSVYSGTGQLRSISEVLLGTEQSADAVMEITDEHYLDSGAGLLWSYLIQRHNNIAHTVSVHTTNDLETMLIFHQGKAVVASGRSFSPEDYREGHQVCIISATLAKINGLQPGDSISISFSEPGLFAQTHTWYAFYFNHLDIREESNYEVVGIYQIVGNKSQTAYDLYEDTIFIPQKSLNYQPEYPRTMDNFVSFRLTNGKVEAFLEEMEEHELPGLSFTFYDQGYSKVVGALTSMRKTALLLTGVCALVGLGIVLLFSLLFVGRQQRSIAIMYSLGTSRGKALGFLLITVLIVVLLGAGIGGVAGYSLSDRILADVFARNTEKEAVSAAYSEVYGEDTEADFQAIAPDKPLAPLAATGTVLLATLLFSGLFAARVLRAEPIQVLTQKEE
ncbi:MAG: ABC transporter permease, partial [Eubacteriales bacterium]|nr:ABC transporter permease [Eubacteriales bacterium]MDD4768761.1 ABC transporter permease [Eubacteriales bacterium]